MKLNDIKEAVVVWGPISEEGISKLKEEKKLILVSENRPYLIGLKHNAPLLKKQQLPFLYCTDNVIGFLFYKKKIKKTYLFFKDKNDKGIIGICGSLYVSLLSKLHNVELKTMPAAKTFENAADKDASTLGGQDFIFQKKQTRLYCGGKRRSYSLRRVLV